MKHYFFKDVQFSFLVALAIFGTLFLSISTFASLNKDTLPPDNELQGGSFMYWIQEILVPDSLPEQDAIFQTHQELHQPTVKKSHRLVDNNQSPITIAQNNALGIGTDSPTKTVEISGNSPRVLVSSVAKNPQITLIAKGKEGKIFFQHQTKELIFSQNKKHSLSINKDGNANAQRFVSENNTILVTGNQKCPSGLFVKGFNRNGRIQCY